MIVILKQSLLLLLAALILAVASEGTIAAHRGIRGSQGQQSDSLAIGNTKRELKKQGGKNKIGEKKGKKKVPSSVSTPIETVGRLDIPTEDSPVVPVPLISLPTLNDWIEGCSTDSTRINTCSPNTSRVCKNCMFALSFTSLTPSTAGGAIKACSRDFCGSCSMEVLTPFFECGFGISNPIDESATPTPTNAANVIEDANITETAPALDESVYDLRNCPAVYPESDTYCTILEGFEFKRCMYYEVGANVMCECSEDEPIWNCTGTITNEEYIVDIKDLEVTIEKEATVEVLPSLPSIDQVVSRMEGDEQYPVALLCPINTPSSGQPCATRDFTSIDCCYSDPDTSGTVTCTCSDGGSGGFDCKSGSLSTCTI